MRRSVHSVLAVSVSLLIFGLSSLTCSGQSSQSASIVGVVADESGAPMANVSVKATSTALQVPAVATSTDSAGNYKLVDLPAPGVYRVTFEVQGFQAFVRDGLNLSVGFNARVDVAMKVGSVTQTVEVSGESPVVDTVSNAGQTTLQLEQLQTAPRGASIQELIPMVSGMNVSGKPDVGDSNLAVRASYVTYGIPLQATLDVEGIRHQYRQVSGYDRIS